MALIRKLMIESRNRIEDREARDQAILENALDFLKKEKPTTKRLFTYVSAGSEASTTLLIEDAFRNGIQVFCPKVISEHHMEFFEIFSLDELLPGYYGIPEPVLPEGMKPDRWIQEKAVYPENEETDLAIIPGLLFDENGGRMGYGSGFYDRYFTIYSAYKLALAYEIQVQPDVIRLTDHDVRMDALITDKCVRVFDKAHED